MQYGSSRFLIVLALFVSLSWGQNAPPQNPPQNGGDFSTNLKPDPSKVVPKDTIIAKGAWSSASDSATPVPEGGSIARNAFTNPYFGLTLPLPPDWIQKHSPPPPSDTGGYVLAQLTPGPTYSKEKSRGVIMFAAQDMFFTPLPAANARQLVNYSKNHLQGDYQVELKPTQTTTAGQPFIFYTYWAPAAGIHWYVLSTQIRCHAVQIVMSSQDTKLLESLVLELNKMKLPAEASPTGGTGGGNVPVCIKDYAKSENIIEHVDPIFTVRRFNPVPVRIVIDKEGKIKHIHFLSAFPEQEKAISEALKQWKFRPYERDGQRVEVETGIMFGSAPQRVAPTAEDAATD
ncbi:MAG TPA: energy transducer TonB [Candidatus Angelobacter sp.]